MNIVVNNISISNGFINFIKQKTFGYMATILNIDKLDVYDEYFKYIHNTDILAKKVIILSMSNLSHDRQETTTTIYINPDLKYPGTNINLIDLCKIINNGNLNIPSYPIFTQTFEHIQNNLPKYLDKFIIGIG